MNILYEIKTIYASEILANEYPEQELIYELLDPRDWSVRYVGRSKDPWQRWYRHMSDPQPGKMAEWITDLARNKLDPFLDFIEWVDEKDAARAERTRINYRLAQNCDLYNIQSRKAVCNSTYRGKPNGQRK
jgi:hypothetical protein